jgi:signal transduction histidine kinase
MLELWVRDNGRGVATGAGEGVGLENTRERLATLYGDRAMLTLEGSAAQGAVARVRLPYSTSKAAIGRP